MSGVPRLQSILLIALCLCLSVQLLNVHARRMDDHCTGCIDGQPTSTCPKPQQCGYQPILCVDCMDGMAMPLCPNASWCQGIDCSKMQCVGGIPTASCPDPGTCNYQPIPCYGCVPGLHRNRCPHPEWCYNNMTTYPCIDCMDGMGMPLCPNATYCKVTDPEPPCSPSPTPTPPGPSPVIQCIDCMPGMAMPQCPYPDLCVGQNNTNSDNCMMEMYFGASTSTCLFLASWSISNGLQWAGAFFAVLLLAALREGLSVWRVHSHLVRKQEAIIRKLCGNKSQRSSDVPLRSPLLSNAHGEQPGEGDTSRSSSDSVGEPSSPFLLHLVDSTYYLFSLILAYLLMLVIMTYNVWLCLMTVLNCAITHLFFNYLYYAKWRKSYMNRVKAIIDTYKSDSVNASAASSSTKVVVEGQSKPTGGDHCCDDLDFDDI